MLSNNEAIEILIRNNAIRDGHFVLRSGKHARQYIDKDEIFTNPDDLSLLCESLAEKLAKIPVDCIIGPAEGAIGAVQWTTWHLRRITGRKILATYASKDIAKTGRFGFKDAFSRRMQGLRVAVIEDISTTGESTRNVVELVRSHQGNVVVAGLICNRGGVTAKNVGDVPLLVSVAKLDLDSWLPSECPICKNE